MRTLFSLMKSIKWPILCTVALSLFYSNLLSSNWVYKYYFSGFFQCLRWLWDHGPGLSPIPWIYILVVGVLVIAILCTVKQWKYGFEARYFFFWRKLFTKTLNAVCIIVFLFFLLWGFNYKRDNFFTELGVEIHRPDSTELMEEAVYTIGILNQLRGKISKDSTALDTIPVFLAIESEIRINQKKLLDMFKVPNYGQVRVRKVHPEGTLLGWSAAGIYIPFVMEGHVDGGLHQLQWPFVAAHEMAHGYGYTDEGDCNFVGFLTCLLSDDSYIQYSAWLGYFRYLYFDIRALNKQIAIDMYQKLLKGVRSDLTAISEQSNKFPDLLPWWRDLVYHNYLKVQGVKEGLRSYNLIVRQVISWKKEGKFPALSH